MKIPDALLKKLFSLPFADVRGSVTAAELAGVFPNRNREGAARSASVARLNPRIGASKGEFVVPDSFFGPLPDEILNAFSGK
jgi:hypothetical protein